MRVKDTEREMRILKNPMLLLALPASEDLGRMCLVYTGIKLVTLHMDLASFDP